MIETVAPMSWLPIIGSHEDRVPTSQPRGPWYQAPLDHASEGLFTARQGVFPRRRRVVDGVSSHYACGLRVHQSVQAIGRRSVPRQVWGSTRVSGSRDTTSDGSSKSVLGKATQLQVGRIRHNRQHPKRQQSNLVWLQALCSRGTVLVCPSIVLEEEVVIALQRSCSTQGKAQALRKAVVSAQSQRANSKKFKTQGSRTGYLERVQGCAEVQPLRDETPCSHRLSPRYQGRQEVSQQTCHSA